MCLLVCFACGLIALFLYILVMLTFTMLSLGASLPRTKVQKYRELGTTNVHCRELEHLKLILGSAHCAAIAQFKAEGGLA